MKKSTQTHSGYTLLFAVLTATLVLGVSVFILSVSTKQYQLAVAARESMYALYAADSAMECAAKALRTGAISNTIGTDTSSNAVISCAGENVPNPFEVVGRNVTDRSEDDFTGLIYKAGPFQMELPEKTCASVTVKKGVTLTGRKVIIDTSGYNYCTINPLEPDPSTRTVERGLRLQKEF